MNNPEGLKQNTETATQSSGSRGAPAQDTEVPAEPAEAAAEAEASETAQLQADIAALNDRLLRLAADFDNFRKRTARERAEWHQEGREEVLRELLPVLDHYELGLAAICGTVSDAAWKGFEMIRAQLRGVLERFGVEPIPTVGSRFDPHLHEAVGHEPSSEVPADHVVREVRKGYRVKDRVLRAAQVVVSSGPSVGGGHSDASEA